MAIAVTYTSIVEVMGLNPIQASIFCRSSFCNYLNCVHTCNCDGHSLIHSFICSSNKHTKYSTSIYMLGSNYNYEKLDFCYLYMSANWKTLSPSTSSHPPPPNHVPIQLILNLCPDGYLQVNTDFRGRGW